MMAVRRVMDAAGRLAAPGWRRVLGSTRIYSFPFVVNLLYPCRELRLVGDELGLTVDDVVVVVARLVLVVVLVVLVLVVGLTTVASALRATRTWIPSAISTIRSPPSSSGSSSCTIP